MADIKLPRLLAAAKEFNIGQDTLIDFLVDKGFSKDDLKPTSKLSEEMYRALQQGFSSDKAAKAKSDQLELPKGSTGEAKKKKDEEEILVKKEEKPVAKTKKEEPKPEEVKPVVAEPVAEEVKSVEVVVEEKKEEPVKVETPEIEGPKVVTKIDLSTIDSSTRPKKTAKPKKEEKKEEPVAEEEKPKAKKPKKEEKKEEEVKPVEVVEEKKEEVVVVPPPVQEEEAPPVIENIEVEKLTGPKILGKIQLPVHSDTRPVKDEKKKRKRIPIEKKIPSGKFSSIRKEIIRDRKAVVDLDKVVTVVVATAVITVVVATAVMISRLTKKKFKGRYRKHRPNFRVVAVKARA